jgi:ribosome-binding protein aMBF1 (putative translation factor)
MNCELCGKKEDERAMQEQCGMNLCLSCDGQFTDEELEERTE